MPETDTLPDNATAADFVAHMAEMSGLPRRAARQRAADVLYQVGLDEERYRLLRGFSTGMKQRVKLAQAIVHDPELVFLDEPTNGLDPIGREEMLELIERIHRQLGILVVLSSHILDDVERVCEYVVVLDRGHVVASMPMHGQDDETSDLQVRVDGDPGLSEASRRAGSGPGRPGSSSRRMSSSFPATGIGRWTRSGTPRDDRLAAASAATGEAIAGRLYVDSVGAASRAWPTAGAQR